MAVSRGSRSGDRRVEQPRNRWINKHSSVVREDPLVEGFKAGSKEMGFQSRRDKDIVHSCASTGVRSGFVFKAMSCGVAVNEISRHEYRCHPCRVGSYLFIEISHDYHVVSVAAKVGNKGAEVLDEDLSGVWVCTAFEAEHCALLSVGRCAAS